MKYVVTLNHKRYEVEVEKGEAMILSSTTVQAITEPIVVHSAPAAAPAAVAAPVAAPAGAVTGEPIKSPMPGMIVAVKVAPGTAVKRGDTILVLEAMKMENEIAAPKDGVITQVVVAKGASVQTGDLLAAIQ